MDSKALTIFEKVHRIRNDYLLRDLRTYNERRFVIEMAEGLRGVPGTINDEDVTEYLTANQIQWINDIWEYLHG